MKNVLSLLLILGIVVPVFSQPSKKILTLGKELVGQSAKAPAVNYSSKVLRAQYMLTSQSLTELQEVYSQQLQQIFTDNSLTPAIQAQVLRQLQKSSASTLAMLGSQQVKEYAQWADGVLRERSPKFLPAKDPSIPGLLALSPEPKKYPHMTLRFFREWMHTIPMHEEFPEEVPLLIDALRKRASTIETEMLYVNRKYLKAKKQLDASQDFEVIRFYRKQAMAYSRELVRLSKEAAQCMSDLLYLLNLYPAVYHNSLALLAAKIDASMPTDFTDYLRKKINIPVGKEHHIGFHCSAETPAKPRGITFTGFSK